MKVCYFYYHYSILFRLHCCSTFILLALYTGWVARVSYFVALLFVTCRIYIQRSYPHYVIVCYLPYAAVASHCVCLDSNWKLIFDHPRSGMLVVSVCMYVCQTMTFWMPCRISPRTTGQVRIWRSSGQSQGHRSQKGRKFLFPQCKTLIGNNSGSIKHIAIMFACSMEFSNVVTTIFVT